MKTYELGSSGICVSVIGIGNMSWPGCGFGRPPGSGEPPDAATADRLVAVAMEEGVTLFDTAEAYGCGRAEELLGRALLTAGRRSAVTLVTKVGPVFGAEQIGGRRCRLDCEWIAQRCEASLRRLRTDCIDLYLAHWPDPVTPVEETIEAFSALRQRGLIRAYGVSNFDPSLLDRFARNGTVAATQNAYSLLERDFETALRPVCREHHIPLMAYSPLAKGLLSGRYSMHNLPAPDDSRHGEWHFATGNLARHMKLMERVGGLAKELGTTTSQIALAWCLDQPGLACVVAGARTEEQIRDAAAATRLTLPETVTRELDELTRGFGRNR